MRILDAMKEGSVSDEDSDEELEEEPAGSLD